MLGDGRLSLERERAAGSYDVLAIDAFSGDSIPMHLLTREAMAMYVRHLKPDGVIVFQATNRFVDIAPVVERLAAEFGYARGDDLRLSVEHGARGLLAVVDRPGVLGDAQQEAARAPGLAEAADRSPTAPTCRRSPTPTHNLFRILK